MNQPSQSSGKAWIYTLLSAGGIYMVGSVFILNTFFQNMRLKELFCSWLLVFINAYIGTFIANKALGQRYTGFWVWGMLINGFRIGIFVILLLVILKSNILNNRAFAAITLFGYLVFLVREVFSLHIRSLRMFQEEQK